MQPTKAIYIGIPTLNQGISTHEYAESCELYPMFTEITRIVARKNNFNINFALAQYINQCNKGEHVVLKSYNSFNKSLINRQCFLFNFQNNSRNGLDYYQLFRLLCSDFPKQIISNSVKLIEGSGQNSMSKLLNSKIFINSLYINFIYFEYLEQLSQKLYENDFETEVPLLSLYNWIRQEDLRNIKLYEKPPFNHLIQILLDYAGKYNLFEVKGVNFLNQENIDAFMQQSINHEDESCKISYETFIHRLMHSKAHQKLVDKILFMFENSTNWTNDAAKLLNVKDSNEIHPLNSKKMKPKK